MTIRTDGGEQDLMQKDDGTHTATIDLTEAYHTDLDLVQQGKHKPIVFSYTELPNFWRLWSIGDTRKLV